MIARVFPRKTAATPTDKYAFSPVAGRLPFPHRQLLLPDDISEVHISATFTFDSWAACALADAWQHIAPVKIGGPAIGSRGEEFVPGRYLKSGYVITSRGCPNGCWFCSVPKREGGIRELPICDGWNVLDDNLLACSDRHILDVFAMLRRQREKAHFTGGLEAARLLPWHVNELATIKPKQIFFAYDTPNDYEPLVAAGRMLLDAGFTTQSHSLRCYVLIGHPHDTMRQAERRLMETVEAGFTPFAMLWRDEKGNRSSEWMKFQKLWARPAIIAARLNER